MRVLLFFILAIVSGSFFVYHGSKRNIYDASYFQCYNGIKSVSFTGRVKEVKFDHRAGFGDRVFIDCDQYDGPDSLGCSLIRLIHRAPHKSTIDISMGKIFTGKDIQGNKIFKDKNTISVWLEVHGKPTEFQLIREE